MTSTRGRAGRWGTILLALAAPALAAPPALPGDLPRLDRDDGFEGSGAARLRVACGGSAGDWTLVRDRADPRDSAMRGHGREDTSCLLRDGAVLRDVAAAARVEESHGRIGFVLRHADDEHRLDVEVDLGAGVATATERDGGAPRRTTALFEGAAPGAHDLLALARGDRLHVFLDGRLLLDASGLARRRGAAGLLAAPGGVATFGDLSVRDASGSWILLPPPPERWRVGRPAAARARCLDPAVPGRDVACVFRRVGGELPRGVRLDPSGRMMGAPVGSGEGVVRLEALGPDGSRRRAQLRWRAGSARWTRFPLDPRSGLEPEIAVLYTPDDIGQTITLETLGRPDRNLFRLHRDHPDLKVALMSCPANRYLGERPLAAFPAAIEAWRAIALGDESAWLSLGGHGLTHSPDGDANLDHHEFSTLNSGCNVDHARTATRAYCRRHLSGARRTYRDIGVPDDRVIVMRFPGAVDNPVALDAALDAGFVALLGRRHLGEAGREWWIPTASGREILEIEDTHLREVLSKSRGLESDLDGGRVSAAELPSSAAFGEAVRHGLDLVERRRREGGIVNLTNHFWETFESFGGCEPRYMLLDAILRSVEERHAGRVWYPHAGELALWLELRRRAKVEERIEGNRIVIDVAPPWRHGESGRFTPPWASLRVLLPEGWTSVRAVTMEEESEGAHPIDRSRWSVEGDRLRITFPIAVPLRLIVDRAGG